MGLFEEPRVGPDRPLATLNDESFLEYFSIRDQPKLHQALLGTYYMFTTLSTVGFGDLSPRSDGERVLCILIFIMGNAVFSLILGTFIDIIDTYKEFAAEYEDDMNLLRFYSTLAHFNNGAKIPKELEEHMT